MFKLVLVSLSLGVLLVIGFIFSPEKLFSGNLTLPVSTIQTGTVEAVFTLSPAKPVCGISDGDCSAPLKDFPVEVFRQVSNVKYDSGRTDGNGLFTATLRPGDYYLFYSSGIIKSKIRRDFSVKAGDTVKLQVTVDTGIR